MHNEKEVCMDAEIKKDKELEGSPLPDDSGEISDNYSEIEKGLGEPNEERDTIINDEEAPAEQEVAISKTDLPGLEGKQEGDTITLTITGVDGDNYMLSSQEQEEISAEDGNTINP